MIYLSAWFYDSIVQGTTVIAVQASQLRNGWVYNNSNTDGDGIQFKKRMNKGTYTCKLLTYKAASLGILKVKIDGEVVMTFDGYNAGDVYNIIATQAGIEISADGVKTIQFVIDGKNGSSSGYYYVLSEMAFYPTA